MRLISNKIHARERAGAVVLEAEDSEDIWHLYNLVRPGDHLSTFTRRKVKSEGSTSTKTETVTGNLTIRVLSLDYDSQTSELHVPGRVVGENAIAPIGSHHTLDLELHKPFTLTKDPDGNVFGGRGDGVGWDNVAIDILKDATDVTRRAEIYAVIMEEGMANICCITEHQTKQLQCVKESIPKKRAGAGSDGHDKGIERFYKTLLATLLRHIDVPALMQEAKQPPLLLASPGFLAAGFHKHMVAYATQTSDKQLARYIRESAIVAHSNGGNLQNLADVLKNPHVLPKLSDTKYARETQKMERFMDLLRVDDGRAWYGPKEVVRAVEKGAVTSGGGTLLISNKLFRSADVEERKKWAALVETVRKDWGGDVLILSSAHESGKRLEGLSGIAAILTFPLLDLDEEEEEERPPVETNGARINRELDEADLGL